jgi:hypothetical protein
LWYNNSNHFKIYNPVPAIVKKNARKKPIHLDKAYLLTYCALLIAASFVFIVLQNIAVSGTEAKNVTAIQTGIRP